VVGKRRLDLKKSCLRIVKPRTRLPGRAEMLGRGRSGSGAASGATSRSRAPGGTGSDGVVLAQLLHPALLTCYGVT